MTNKNTNEQPIEKRAIFVKCSDCGKDSAIKESFVGEFDVKFDYPCSYCKKEHMGVECSNVYVRDFDYVKDTYFEVKGHGGQLLIKDGSVNIGRKGFLAFGMEEARIPIETVIGVRFEEPGGWHGGYIHFVIFGENDDKGDSWKPETDKYTVMFFKDTSEFEKIKNFIESVIPGNQEKQEAIKLQKQKECDRLEEEERKERERQKQLALKKAKKREENRNKKFPNMKDHVFTKFSVEDDKKVDLVTLSCGRCKNQSILTQDSIEFIDEIFGCENCGSFDLDVTDNIIDRYTLIHEKESLIEFDDKVGEDVPYEKYAIREIYDKFYSILKDLELEENLKQKMAIVCTNGIVLDSLKNPIITDIYDAERKIRLKEIHEKLESISYGFDINEVLEDINIEKKYHHHVFRHLVSLKKEDGRSFESISKERERIKEIIQYAREAIPELKEEITDEKIPVINHNAILAVTFKNLSPKYIEQILHFIQIKNNETYLRKKIAPMEKGEKRDFLQKHFQHVEQTALLQKNIEATLKMNEELKAVLHEASVSIVRSITNMQGSIASMSQSISNDIRQSTNSINKTTIGVNLVRELRDASRHDEIKGLMKGY